MPATEADCAVVPTVGRVPAQGLPVAPPPLAVQLLTFCELQLRVNDSPTATLLGPAVRLTASTGGERTVTGAWEDAAGSAPHSPPQLMVKVNSPTVDEEKSREPEAVCAPCQPTSAGAPAASQPLAWSDDQLTVKCSPVLTVVGVTQIEAVGAGGANTVSDIGADEAPTPVPLPRQWTSTV